MTELASNFTTIFIDYFFFVHTNFLNFFFLNLRTKRRQQVIPGGFVFLSYRHNCSRKKNRKVGEPAKNVFFPGKQRGFFGEPEFFSRGVRSILFFFFLFF